MTGTPDTPRVETEWREDRLLATAIVGAASKEYRCRVNLSTWSNSAPRVSFANRVPGSEVHAVSDWIHRATGSLSGPQRLRDWYHYFRAFELALAAVTDEIGGAMSEGQRRAFEKNHGAPHPAAEDDEPRIRGPWHRWTTYPSGPWEHCALPRGILEHNLADIYWLHDPDDRCDIYRSKVVPVRETPDWLRETIRRP